MNFHYITYMTKLQHNKPCPGGHNIYNFCRPFHGHHYYILYIVLSLSDLCSGVEKKVFYRNASIFHFLCSKLFPLYLQFLLSLYHKYLFLLSSKICYIPNLVKICPVVIEKISTDDGLQTIAIGHLGDSGDLILSNTLTVL